MTQGLLFGSGTSTRSARTGTNAPVSAPTESQKGSVAVTLTGYYARALVSRPPSQRASYRQQIVKLLQKARDPEGCIDALLHICTTEGGEHGLDAAIDVLANAGKLILDYAWDYLQKDVRNWNPETGKAYQPNDDYWHVLLRAVGRADVSQKERFRFITCCAQAESRGIREGVVEGLRDLGTKAARNRIQRFAEEDQDGFIRRIAGETLEDMEN